MMHTECRCAVGVLQNAAHLHVLVEQVGGGRHGCGRRQGYHALRNAAVRPCGRPMTSAEPLFYHTPICCRRSRARLARRRRGLAGGGDGLRAAGPGPHSQRACCQLRRRSTGGRAVCRRRARDHALGRVVRRWTRCRACSSTSCSGAVRGFAVGSPLRCQARRRGRWLRLRRRRRSARLRRRAGCLSRGVC